MRLRVLTAVALLSALSAHRVGAQAARTTVSGIVRDSISHAPLAAATVQLVAPDSLARLGRSTVSDSLGRFRITDVADGQYMIGFYHPLLDSLGVEPPPRAVRVEGHQPVVVDLATPSADRIRVTVCGVRAPTDSTALLMGVVRDVTTHAPAAGVKVAGEWLELAFRPDGVDRHQPRLVATTGDNGWFAICNVPRSGTMFLMASRGADSTDMIEVQIPADGFLRRELFLGPSRRIASTAAGTPDSAGVGARMIRVGDGRLSGTVLVANGTRPLAGAQVRIADGMVTRTNERGEWTITDAPGGTRVLDVRAIGYYPERRTVDVVDNAAPVQVALSTLKAVLDTVRISASRVRYGIDRGGFEQRARSAGTGRFITADDIKRRPVTNTTDVFRLMAGVRLERDSSGFTKQLQVRGMMADWCTPSIYLNGGFMSGFDADEIDAMVQPEHIKGIEIYTGPGIPAAFQQGMTGCGSIVIWTR
ncbi:MAG: hypothetical protein EBS65_20865 [Betaproteobacteria bacterium]|nr:hypothetical protein [Betaproteobacteria bacterium]